MKRKLSMAMLGVLFCSVLLAAPAPWYKWRSKIDGQTFCAQTSPGDGWQRAGGPYQDARCEKPGVPG